MACFHPLTAWQLESGDIVFAERGRIKRELTLPCGQCIGCRLNRARQWATRVMHEASLYDRTCFVTLTYSDENLPSGLVYRHFQLFMKRLRKQKGKVRFFMCGEYGENTFRPHYHGILFGVRFDDRVLFSEKNGVRLDYSAELERLWGKGFCSVGDVTFDSACYVASYCVKKRTGDKAQDWYSRVIPETGEFVEVAPEFMRCSLRPGIGREWFDRYRSEVYSDRNDRVVMNGVEAKPPRYYDKLLEQSDDELYAYIQKVRYDRDREPEEGSDARLKVREVVALSKFNQRSRNVEC